MKVIWRKNQVIIVAFAIMVIVAWYLQFTASDEKSADTVSSVFGESTNDDAYDSELVGMVISENALSEESEQEAEAADIGEAVLVSTTITTNFAGNAKLVREQMRAKSKETLMGIISSELVTDEQKQIAVESLTELTRIAEKENAAELLLEAKGFPDAVVNIVDNEVDVVINAPAISDREVAQIEDIVTRKTGFKPENIVITATIQED